MFWGPLIFSTLSKNSLYPFSSISVVSWFFREWHFLNVFHPLLRVGTVLIYLWVGCQLPGLYVVSDNMCISYRLENSKWLTHYFQTSEAKSKETFFFQILCQDLDLVATVWTRWTVGQVPKQSRDFELIISPLVQISYCHLPCFNDTNKCAVHSHGMVNVMNYPCHFML